MATSLKKKYLHKTPYTILALVVIFFLCSHTPNTGYDTPSYVQFSIVRPPIYPLFIWLFHWAGKYQFQFVMWAQSILTFSSLLYARYWLIKNLKVSDFLIFFVFLFVLITICFHFQMWYIESEGLSFPFFIFTFFLLMRCVQEFNIKRIVYLALWVALLILTRLQFYYFYGVFILLCGWYLWRKVPIKSMGICVLILLGSILLTFLADRSYHYLKQGVFEGEPTSGVQFVIQPLFLANTNAIDYFKNATQKAIVQKMLYKIREQKLNQTVSALKTFKLQHYEYAYEEYNKNYLSIQSIVYNTFTDLTAAKQNKITLSIAKILTCYEMKRNFYFYCWKVIDSMGGVPWFLFFCLLLFSTAFKIFRNRNSSDAMFINIAVSFKICL